MQAPVSEAQVLGLDKARHVAVVEGLVPRVKLRDLIEHWGSVSLKSALAPPILTKPGCPKIRSKLLSSIPC